MGKRKAFRGLVIVAVMFAATFSPSVAGAAAPPSPVSPPTRDLGIHAERTRLLAHAPGAHSSAGARSALTTCSATWRLVNSPDGTWNNFLVGISAVSPKDMWAVGNSQSQVTGRDQNLAEHWDGTAWTVVPTPQPGADSSDLNAVAAIASNDAWAVGFYKSSGQPQGEALHWNGASWNATVVPSETTATVFNSVYAVATNDVWVVGTTDNGSGVHQPLAMHWNGSWTVYTVPAQGLGDNELFGVGGSGTNSVWAVGYSRDAPTGPRKSLIQHFTGGPTWAYDPSPNFSTDTLISVAAASESNAVAVGYAIGSNGGPIGIWYSGTDHLDGTPATWQLTGISEPSVVNEVFTDVVVSAAGVYWGVGYDDNNGAGPIQPFAVSGGSTSGQNGFPAMATFGGGDNRVFSAAVPAADDVWAVGQYNNPQKLSRNLVETYSGLAAPAGVSAVAGDQSALVSWTGPCGDGGSPITSYVVIASDGCTIQASATVTAPATTANLTGLSDGMTYTFTVAPVNGFGLGPRSAPSSAVAPHGTATTGYSACTAQQYMQGGSDGVTWRDMDATSRLTLTFTPAVDSYAIFGGNADLWTAQAGYNQDIAINVNGAVAAWKESGGRAGAYSPNAAYVQAVLPVLASTSYTAKLQWKANRADPGAIFAGAGGADTGFSPTRLTVRLVPKTAATVFSTTSTQQYRLYDSDGQWWTTMDPVRLSLQVTIPSGNWFELATASADLWTPDTGVNQDIGIFRSNYFSYPPRQPVAWKESGGSATFSPNAAHVESFTGGAGPQTATYSIVWKTNKSDLYRFIYAGAGPLGGQFSPTTLTVVLVPEGSPDYPVIGSTSQYSQAISDGSSWQTIDATNLSLTLSPHVSADYAVGLSADLWTSAAGYNQDMGIMVSGGAYGGGTLVTWKESGGFAGTFSPNAAYASTVLRLDVGPAYTIWAVYKANTLARAYYSIYAGAGPVVAFGSTYPFYSPTSLTAQLIG